MIIDDKLSKNKKVSIFEHIYNHINPLGPGLMDDGDLLPDDEIIGIQEDIHWAPGAMDVMGAKPDSVEAAEIDTLAEDFLAAFTFLKKIQSIPSILPVGYSFGSYVIYHSLNQIEEKCAVILIAPPVDVMDFGENEALKQHQFFIITGESDEYCSPRSAEKLALRLDAQLTVFPQIDHFFRGDSEKLQGEITRCINMFCSR